MIKVNKLVMCGLFALLLMASIFCAFGVEVQAEDSDIEVYETTISQNTVTIMSDMIEIRWRVDVDKKIVI